MSNKGRTMSPREMALRAELDNPDIGDAKHQLSVNLPKVVGNILPVPVPSSKLIPEGFFGGVIENLRGGYGFISQNDLSGRENNAYFRTGRGSWKIGQKVVYRRQWEDRGYLALEVKDYS